MKVNYENTKHLSKVSVSGTAGNSRKPPWGEGQPVEDCPEGAKAFEEGRHPGS